MASRVKSVRADEGLWARVEARALALGISANVLVVQFMEAGLSPGTDAPEPKPKASVPKPAAEKVKAEKVKRIAASEVKAPEPEGQAQGGDPRLGGLSDNQRAMRAIHAPPPERPAYGSMLKQPKAAKRR